MLITFLNTYNPLNNIKFTKEKKSEKKKIYPVLDLSKVKYHTKIKEFRINEHKKF